MLKQPGELVHVSPDQRPKSPFGKFLVIWNEEASVWRIGTSQNDVAPVLLVEFVSQLSESLNGIAAGNLLCTQETCLQWGCSVPVYEPEIRAGRSGREV